MYDLTPEEIFTLNKIQGRRVDDTTYSNEIINKFCSYGLLCIGTTVQSLECSDMATIRKLLKEKGLKAGGKKVDLVQRILQNYSDTELECAEIPKRFTLTEAGKQFIDKNDTLLFYLVYFGNTDILNPEQIISAQCSYPNEDKLDILIRLFKEEISIAKTIGTKRVVTSYLGRLYEMKHDDILVRETEVEVERLDKLWEEERERDARKQDAILGMSLEERKQLQQKIIDEMDDSWERELDAKNRAKAGIKVEQEKEYYRKPKISPYILNEKAKKLITDIQTGIVKLEEAEQEILELLEKMKASNMSTYQLSITYKMMGDIYFNCNIDDKCLTMYETGISLYPNLPVKKAIKTLKKRLL